MQIGTAADKLAGEVVYQDSGQRIDRRNDDLSRHHRVDRYGPLRLHYIVAGRHVVGAQEIAAVGIAGEGQFLIARCYQCRCLGFGIIQIDRNVKRFHTAETNNYRILAVTVNTQWNIVHIRCRMDYDRPIARQCIDGRHFHAIGIRNHNDVFTIPIANRSLFATGNHR